MKEITIQYLTIAILIISIILLGMVAYKLKQKSEKVSSSVSSSIKPAGSEYFSIRNSDALNAATFN